MRDEAEITCPYCWETISLALDLSVDEQDYIEDCSICCHPLRLRVSAVGGQLISIGAERADG